MIAVTQTRLSLHEHEQNMPDFGLAQRTNDSSQKPTSRSLKRYEAYAKQEGHHRCVSGP